ncbi:MAG: 30S ribosomal protein S12 methylthiotransferase RimO [Eubacteriales bacterium]|nr:30S ribosomal protein S12 methylthiotransferase RimO [Eubacteriales bacterium]
MKILFVSLGCDKNLVDSEEMLGDLTRAGYEITDDEEIAEAAIVNTCCFINDAKKESIESILELADRRTAGQLRALIVTGCLAQRYSEEILKEIPEVDAVIGTTAQEALLETLNAVCGGGSAGAGSDGSDQTENERKEEDRGPALVRLQDLKKMPRADAKRVLTTVNGYGYLRIAEGCGKYCTYCVIPYIRGPYRSVPMEQVLRTARDLADQGVRELILVAQETTLYGTDLYGEKKLPELLHALAGIEGIHWIRLLYCYPEEITPELVRTIKEEPKVLHYIDIPIQHASDDVLRRMGRRANRKDLEETVRLLRQEIPDICIRTTLISGFPGELEKDHKTLLSFVRKMKFDRLGVFAYSREEGTPAAKMAAQIPAPVKKKRRKELMLLQQEIAFKKARRMKGRVVEAIIEGRIAGEDVYTARTYMDAPGVDGTLFVETGRELMTGDFIAVKITGSDQYDLIGVPAQ